MGAAAAVIPRTVGPLLGPIGLAPSEPARRIAYVKLDDAQLLHSLAYGDKFRQFLPTGARVLGTSRDESERQVIVRFTKPSLREIEDHEAVPEYKLHDNPNGGWYWGEVSP